MKKCPICKAFSQDTSTVCGICGTNIAYSSTLEGRIEDEIVRDRKAAEQEHNFLAGEFARRQKPRLIRRLLEALLVTGGGVGLLIYSLSQILSYRGYYPVLIFPDFAAFIGSFLVILIGINLGMKGGNAGGRTLFSPTSGIGQAKHPTDTLSNQSMRATYDGQFLPREKRKDPGSE